MRQSAGSALSIPVAVATAVGFIVAPATPASAAPQALTPVEVDGGQLQLPPLPVEMLDFRNQLFETYGSNPNFGLTEVSLDRTEFTVHWYGEPPAYLADAASEVSDFDVVVEPTAMQPAVLNEMATQVMTDPSLVGLVTSAAPRLEGDGIDVTYSPGVPADVVSAALDEAGVTVPVSLDESEAPTSTAQGWRWDDLAPHWAGSTMRKRTGGGCTSAFSVRRNNDGAIGMLTASHCGGVGDVWDAYNAPNSNYFGSTISEDDSRDAAVLAGSTYTRGIYTSAYNTSSGGTISAYITVLSVGDELCFSGGYSGWNCGNIITVPSYSYNPVNGNGQPLLSQPATGARSVKSQSAGAPAAGNGDSGGPGVVVYRDANGLLRPAAATIISAISDATTTCAGVPASPTRNCSYNVVSTNAYAAATNLGYTLLPA